MTASFAFDRVQQLKLMRAAMDAGTTPVVETQYNDFDQDAANHERRMGVLGLPGGHPDCENARDEKHPNNGVCDLDRPEGRRFDERVHSIIALLTGRRAEKGSVGP